MRVDRLVHINGELYRSTVRISMYMQPYREGDGGGGGDLAGRQQGGMLVEIRHVEYNLSPPMKYHTGPGTSQQLTLASLWTSCSSPAKSQNAQLPAGSSAKSQMSVMLPNCPDA